LTGPGNERRHADWSLAEPRQRRRFPWLGGPRERRRTRWSEFRDAYPRIVTAMSVGIVSWKPSALSSLALIQGWPDLAASLAG